MTNWKEYKVGDLVTFQRGHDLPRTEMKEGIYPVAGSNSIIGYHNEFTTKSPGITIGRSGNIGNPQLHKTNFWAHNTVLYVKEFKKVDPVFFYYLLKTLDFSQLNSGSAVPSLNRNFIHPFKVSIPEDLPTQTAIAEILSSLDDKIELNNKINQELENLAQTLFKQWFIDFEFPANLADSTLSGAEGYKSSGGDMVESELGEIPKGWEVYSMSDLLETVSRTYPLKTVDEVIFLNTGDIQDGKFLHTNISDPKTLPGQAKKSISINDILYSEIRPANKRFAFVHFDSSKYVVSTKLMVLRSKVEINSLFQYFILTQKEQIEYLQRLAESRSGTFPQITFSEVSTIKIALPSFDKVNLFVENVLEPFFSSKFSSEFENQELTNLRDTLLPKLILGELEVKNINF
jgi:type I restriction enzyme, S subunit